MGSGVEQHMQTNGTCCFVCRCRGKIIRTTGGTDMNRFLIMLLVGFGWADKASLLRCGCSGRTPCWAQELGYHHASAINACRSISTSSRYCLRVSGLEHSTSRQSILGYSPAPGNTRCARRRRASHRGCCQTPPACFCRLFCVDNHAGTVFRSPCASWAASHVDGRRSRTLLEHGRTSNS